MSPKEQAERIPSLTGCDGRGFVSTAQCEPVRPPALAERARSQGRYRDEASILRATKIVYLLLGALVLAAFVYVLLERFSPAEVFKFLALPPVLVGGGFLRLDVRGYAGRALGLDARRWPSSQSPAD